jgi:phosphohistidine phosphatase
MRRTARGLKRLVPDLDVLATSPHRRARETADILADVYGRATAGATNGATAGARVPVTVSALVPDEPLETARVWLATQPQESTVAMVGHEPHLSRLASWLLTGQERALFELSKGGACLLAFDGDVAAGRARLCWLLRAGQLRRLR